MGVASGLGEGGKTDPRHGEYSILSKQRRVGKHKFWDKTRLPNPSCLPSFPAFSLSPTPVPYPHPLLGLCSQKQPLCFPLPLPPLVLFSLS